MEEWRPIPFPGYEGWYEASNLGRVRRASAHNPRSPGRSGQIRTPQARPAHSKARNLRPKMVLLFNYKRYATEVGHLVALAFHGVPPNGYQCNHIDGDPWNNTPDNLEWVTRLENMRHAHRNRLLNLPRGSQQSQAKLTDDAVRAIRQSTLSQRALANQYGVSKTAITQVLNRTKWAHVV